jgi:DNA (cytosine-5)-methyltransferase 1
MSQYTLASLFSGCSGSDYAFTKCGFKISFSVETNSGACATYKENLGISPLQLPVNLVLDYEGFYDIVIGGPPCQSFSKANSGVDRNSASGFKNIENFQVFVNNHKPLLFIMENVPALVIDEQFTSYYRRIIHGFPGYKVVANILNAEDYGCPQQRKRVFFLGIQERFGIPFQAPVGKHWTSLYSGWAEYLNLPLEGLLKRRVSVLSGRNPFEAATTVIGGEVMYLQYKNNSPKIGGSFSANELYLLEGRYLTEREMARLQGFPSSYKFVGNSKEVFKQIGNAWNVNVALALAKESEKLLDVITGRRDSLNVSHGKG